MLRDFQDLSASSRQVVDVVWRRGPSSRSEIAIGAGLTKPAISQIVDDLTLRGLLTEQPGQLED